MTNEQMCAFIAEGDSDELIPLLWEKVRKLCHMLAEKRYSKHTERAAACGIEFSDIRQEAYFSFLAALQAYNRKQPHEFKFTSFLDFHVRQTVNTLLGFRTPRTLHEPLNNCDSPDEAIPYLKMQQSRIDSARQSIVAVEAYVESEGNYGQ
jgi:hypothetical protein